MDPADTQRALSAQGAAISWHEQSIQIAHQSITALVQSVEALVKQMSCSTGSGAAGGSYACDPEPFNRDLDSGVFVAVSACSSMRLSSPRIMQRFTTLLVCYGASLVVGPGQLAVSMSLEDFLKHFECVFGHPNLSGCAGERLFMIHPKERARLQITRWSLRPWWKRGPALLIVFCRGPEQTGAGLHPKNLVEMIEQGTELDNFQQASGVVYLYHPPWCPVCRRFSPPLSTDAGGALPADSISTVMPKNIRESQQEDPAIK